MLDPALFTYATSNKEMISVDKNGRVTPVSTYDKDGTATVTAVLKDDLLNRKIKFQIKVLKTAQVDRIRINQGSDKLKKIQNIWLFLDQGDTGQEAKEMVLLYQKDQELIFIPHASNSRGKEITDTAKLVWSVSDKNLASVRTVSALTVEGDVIPIAIVTIKKEGTFKVTCQAGDGFKKSESVMIRTVSGTPRISTTSVSFNKNDKRYISTPFDLIETNEAAVKQNPIDLTYGKIVEVRKNNKILSSDEQMQFSIVQNPDKTYAVAVQEAYVNRINESGKEDFDGTYQITFQVTTDAVDDLAAISETYDESAECITPFTIQLKTQKTSPAVKIANPEINLFYKDVWNSSLDVTASVGTRIRIEPVKGQSNHFDQIFAFSNHLGTTDYDDYDAWSVGFCKKDGKSVLTDEADEYIRKGSKKISGKVNIYIDGYKEPAISNVNLTINTPTAAPKPEIAAVTSMDLENMEYLSLNVIDANTKKKLSDYRLISSSEEKLHIYKKDNGMLSVGVRNGVSVANGTTLSSDLLLTNDNWVKPLNMKLSVKVYTDTPAVSLKKTSFTVNVNAPNEAVSTVCTVNRGNVDLLNSNLWNVKSYNPKSGKYDMDASAFKVAYQNGELSVSLNADSEAFASLQEKEGIYKLRIANILEGYPYVYQDISVKVLNKTPSASVKVKGTIDLLNRSQSQMTGIVSFKNISGKIVGVSFTDNEDYYPILSGGNQFTIRLKSQAKAEAVKTNITVKLTMSGGKVFYTNMSLTPKQSVPKIKVSNVQTIRKTGRGRYISYDLQDGMEKGIRIDDIKPVNVPQGLALTVKGKNVYVHLTDDALKTGTYQMKVNVYFKGAQSIFGDSKGKPVTVTIPVIITE